MMRRSTSAAARALALAAVTLAAGAAAARAQADYTRSFENELHIAFGYGPATGVMRCGDAPPECRSDRLSMRRYTLSAFYGLYGPVAVVLRLGGASGSSDSTRLSVDDMQVGARFQLPGRASVTAAYGPAAGITRDIGSRRAGGSGTTASVSVGKMWSIPQRRFSNEFHVGLELGYHLGSYSRVRDDPPATPVRFDWPDVRTHVVSLEGTISMGWALDIFSRG